MSISFSSGFNISSSASLTLGTSAATVTNYFLSADSNIAFQTIYLSSVSTLTTSTNFALTGVNTPWSEMTDNYVWFVVATAIFSSTTSPMDVLILILETTANDLTFSSYSPSTSLLLGATSLTFTATISLKLPGPIYSGYGAKVVVVVDTSISALGEVSITLGSTSLTSTSSSNTITSETIGVNIASASTLTITLTDATPPSSAGSSIYIFNSVTIKDSANIYTWVDTTVTTQGNTTFNAATAAGSATINSIDVFPNVAGALLAYFTFSFMTPYDLPAGTVVTLSGDAFATDASIADNTWCSNGFTQAAFSGTNLAVTLAYDAPASSNVIIRKDYAYNNPSTGNAWTLTAVYDSTTILANVTTTVKFTYVAAPANTVSTATIVPEITNMGSDSWHVVTLTFSTNFLAT